MRRRGRNTTTMFKPGNIPWNKGMHFEDSDSGGEDLEQSSPSFRHDRCDDAVTEDSAAQRALRPRLAEAATLEKESTPSTHGMRLVGSEQMTELFNTAYKNHAKERLDCTQPHMAIAEEKKWGVCWKMSLKCTNCSFVTPLRKLYTEAESSNRGPNPAAANVGLAVGLQDTPMGNTRCRYLLATMDIPPPTRKSMQRTSNRVSTAVTQLNTADMAEKIELVKQHNRSSGQPDNIMNISVDGRYNSASISSRSKPGQNASQAVAIACETVTDKQYIVAAAIQNNLCWTGAWLRAKGWDVKCPGGHQDCTANTYRHQPLSEYELGKRIGEQLSVQEAFVKYVTTDGDARSAAGVAEAMRLLDPLWKVERQADPTHVGQAQFRACYNAKFSQQMFPAKTREGQMAQQKGFSRDIKARCSLIMDAVRHEHAGDVTAMKKVLPLVLKATVSCYSGDCSQCRRHSYVCSGGSTSSWWNRSKFLSNYKIFSLHMDDNDTRLVMEMLKMKLSVAALDTMHLGTSTQKCEAVNRSLSVSLPKNNDFSRNVHGRVASTIHRLNNGIAGSAEKKLKHVGVRLSDRSRECLQKMQDREEYEKNYVKSSTVQKRKLLTSGKCIREHLEFKAANPDVTSDYAKGQLDPKPSCSNSLDHSYV